MLLAEIERRLCSKEKVDGEANRSEQQAMVGGLLRVIARVPYANEQISQFFGRDEHDDRDPSIPSDMAEFFLAFREFAWARASGMPAEADHQLSRAIGEFEREALQRHAPVVRASLL
jgi:hypothetical protein